MVPSSHVKNGVSATPTMTAAAVSNAVRLDVSLVPVQVLWMARATETATVPTVVFAATELALGTMEVVEKEVRAGAMEVVEKGALGAGAQETMMMMMMMTINLMIRLLWLAEWGGIELEHGGNDGRLGAPRLVDIFLTSRYHPMSRIKYHNEIVGTIRPVAFAKNAMGRHEES